jgi:hypothetical protein
VRSHSWSLVSPWKESAKNSLNDDDEEDGTVAAYEDDDDDGSVEVSELLRYRRDSLRAAAACRETLLLSAEEAC